MPQEDEPEGEECEAIWASTGSGHGSTWRENFPRSDPKLNEDAARAMIQQELDIIQGVPDDNEDVQQLVSEGHEIFWLEEHWLCGRKRKTQERSLLLIRWMPRRKAERRRKHKGS
ncbi:hypothetical protein MHU86_20374 [Fragilaria crotonensis]|nr:hypothetical protein MHU86_20374 [Fragilaria crotonensis]